MAAKAQRSEPAQIGAGDSRVVAHPGFRKVPKCLFPLGTKEAQNQYDALARMLFDAGRFSLAAHHALSSYAMQFDVITKASNEGRPIRANYIIHMEKARRELGLDALDKPIAAPSEAKGNKFARFGFSARRR